jgi:hypothetical protein
VVGVDGALDLVDLLVVLVRPHVGRPVGDCVGPRAEVQSGSGVGSGDPGWDGWSGCLGETAC